MIMSEMLWGLSHGVCVYVCVLVYKLVLVLFFGWFNTTVYQSNRNSARGLTTAS